MSVKRLIPLINEFPANKLPTELDALGYFLNLEKYKFNHLTCKKSALETVREVMILWDHAFIETIEQRNAMRKFFSGVHSIYKR